MSINSSLANALSGLRATTKMTEAASNNLANVLTDGYGRQVAELSSVALGGQGAGVRVTAIERAMAPEYTAPRRQADGEAAEGTVLAEALARIGQALGEADADDGLFDRLRDFETRLSELAETPEAEPRQIAAIETARDLAAFLNRLSGTAATLRQDADAAIAADVTTVNRNLQEVAELNAKIQRLSATDISAPTLVDERERLIDEISAIIPVRTQMQGNGSVHLYTAEGTFLLQQTPAELAFTASPVITAAMMYAPGGAGALSGLTVNGQEISPGSGGRFAVQSGSLAGHFAVRDGTGVEFQSRIDQFAADLIARFQDPAVDPTLAAGDPGLFTDAGGALNLAVIEGLAGRIALNPLADPDQGGSAAVLRDGLQAAAPGAPSSDVIVRQYVDALRTGRSAVAIPGLAGMMGAAQMVSGIVELTAIARTDAETEAGRLVATRAALADSEAQRIGVDQDAELAALIQIEQAYNANVQIIQTVSRMMQELTELR